MLSAQTVAQTVAGLNDEGLDVLEAVYLLSLERQCLYQEIIDRLGVQDALERPQSNHLGALVALSLVDSQLPSEHGFNLRGYTIRDRSATAAALRDQGRLAPEPTSSYKRQRLSPLAARPARYCLAGGWR